MGTGAQSLELTSEAFNETYPVTVLTGAVTNFVDPACRDAVATPGLGGIGGKICNRHTGEVVTDAKITVILADGTELVGNTDPTTGTFEMQVPTGTIAVSVSSPGYSKSYLVEVVAGEITVVEQSAQCEIPDPLSTGFVIGKLCAPGTADEPLEGAAVTAKAELTKGLNTEAKQVAQAIIDRHGKEIPTMKSILNGIAG